MRMTPPDAVFVVLCFEGPDQYSLAGGLGVRARELSRALAEAGFDTHLYFVGEPGKPGEEAQLDGRLTLHRWCQWLSESFPVGVYDGEAEKVREWELSLPGHLIEHVIAPALAAGKTPIVLAEEWQTAGTACVLSELLHYQGLRERVVMLWNTNSLFGFDRIDWSALGHAATITTVSRYMKHRMWSLGLNPVVVPNGIPRAAILDTAGAASAELRRAAGADALLFKIGRFDGDKGWANAVTAVSLLKRKGLKVRLLMRGGREPYGDQVLARAAGLGLTVEDARATWDTEGLAAVIRNHPGADILNLVDFLPDALVRAIYAKVDCVFANSSHEPFGLVGLEVMAAGGVAVTGSTGEDYAQPYRNALVIETDDPLELESSVRLLHERPELAESLRRHGHATAKEFTWPKVIDQLLFRLELAAVQQGARFAPWSDPAPPRKSTRAKPQPQR